MNKDSKLFFGQGNSKLSSAIAIFDLPAGWTCPQAHLCLCKANKITGKVTDGKETIFRCYAASVESLYPIVREHRWSNLNLLKEAKTIEKMAELIQTSLPHNTFYIRVHSSGDFFNTPYFLAWLNVALNNPLVVFYGYTKCLDLLVKYQNHIPDNFRFTASRGGKLDWMINKYHLKCVEVVFSVKEANKKNLQIDHDDSLAISPSKKSFALLLHGRQPKGSVASKALSELKKQGLGSYGRGTKKSVSIQDALKIYVTLNDELPIAA